MTLGSVVIATYNRSERLRACLQALIRQIQPATDFEVVVVVDGSTDNTVEMLAAFRWPFALRVIQQSNQGQCAALNRGAAEAHGPTLIFLDDDIVAAPGLVAGHLQLQRESEHVVGVGQLSLTVPSGADWFARGFADDWRAHYADLNRASRRLTWQDCYSGNLSVSRAKFLDVGGFDGRLARSYDVELAYRLERSGCSFVYLPEAVGDQDERKGYSALIQDAERDGGAGVDLYRRDPSLLPTLLGSFPEQHLSTAICLRALLALDLAPSRLRLVGGLLEKATGQAHAYRIFHRYAFWRGVRDRLADPSGWGYLIHGIPILMYHAFGAPGEAPSRYVMPIRHFERQLAWLKRRGYRVIGLDELLQCRRDHCLPPAHSVVITIDDGYADNRTLAYPALRRYGFPATIFLVSGKVGTVNDWDARGELAGRRLLTWSDVNEMSAGGLQFAAHTRTHPSLTALRADLAREEIVGSRSDLEHQLGGATNAFAYPYGRRNRSLEATAEEAGFLGSCGIDEGMNTPATPGQALRRIEIHGTDSLAHFALAVHFGERKERLWQRLCLLAARKQVWSPC